MISNETEILKKLSDVFKVENADLIEKSIIDLNERLNEYEYKYIEEHKRNELLEICNEEERTKRKILEDENTEISILNSYKTMHIEQLKQDNIKYKNTIIKKYDYDDEPIDIAELRLLKEKYMKPLYIYIIHPTYFIKLLNYALDSSQKTKKLSKKKYEYYNNTDDENYDTDKNDKNKTDKNKTDKNKTDKHKKDKGDRASEKDKDDKNYKNKKDNSEKDKSDENKKNKSDEASEKDKDDKNYKNKKDKSEKDKSEKNKFKTLKISSNEQIKSVIADIQTYNRNFDNIITYNIDNDEIIYMNMIFSKKIDKPDKYILISTQWIANKTHYINTINSLNECCDILYLNKLILYKSSIDEINGIIREEFIKL
jgi:hypothetical protein